MEVQTLEKFIFINKAIYPEKKSSKMLMELLSEKANRFLRSKLENENESSIQKNLSESSNEPSSKIEKIKTEFNLF